MIIDFKGIYPKVDPTTFIAENAIVIGDVEIGPGTNIWFHSIVRGDANYIWIGSNCSIQDACVLHDEINLRQQEPCQPKKGFDPFYPLNNKGEN